jgi:hypothetical protein
LYINSPAPYFIKFNAGDFRHDVNHHWRRTHAKEVVGLGEVLGVVEAASKAFQPPFAGFRKSD